MSDTESLQKVVKEFIKAKTDITTKIKTAIEDHRRERQEQKAQQDRNQ